MSRRKRRDRHQHHLLGELSDADSEDGVEATTDVDISIGARIGIGEGG